MDNKIIFIVPMRYSPQSPAGDGLLSIEKFSSHEFANPYQQEGVELRIRRDGKTSRAFIPTGVVEDLIKFLQGQPYLEVKQNG